ncbi:hypothetical protein [Paenibacillus massiliensis]|uniref:hypothetical protein n=1 Tax=Paenibacillus massiliensis TaxID=225917 RepID=UPI000472A8C8|nr:hypothetical protein [Paenibacillus massiliensis]
MQITPTIRTEIQDYLHKLSLNMSQFASIAGLNAGTISGMLMSNRIMSVHQLDCVTRAMKKPEDYFYSRYIQESLLEASVDWRRARVFLQRCMELNRLDCIAQVANVLMENVTYYAGLVFELAEEFFAQEHYAAAKILYENVALSEKHQHSERLAVCQYRLFKIRIGDDQTQNLRAATLFEPYVERLDEIDQLDALKDLANVYRSLREWDQVEEVAGRMKEKARIQYSIKHQHTSKREASFEKLSRPLFVYIAYADLLCASVCEAREDYQQALQYTYAYANLDWVKETDEDTIYCMNLFQHWAEGNTYVNKLLSGDVSVLQDYVEYIDTTNITNTELVTKLLNVLIAANRYEVDVDHILGRFDTVINSLIEQEVASNEIYAKQVIPEQFVRFGYELAYYYLYRSLYSSGYKYLMIAMSKSHIINNKTYFLNCMGLFLHFQEHALPEIKDGFLNLVEKVWLNNDEKIGNTIHRS